MKKQILITGSEGLIGRHLSIALKHIDFEIIPFDIKLNNQNAGDICNNEHLETRIANCHGIVHLAAVSRVVWGQNNPELCWRTNAEASRNILNIAINSPHKPWVLLASSREVYGEPSSFPVNDMQPVNPVNVYGRSKVAMEQAALEARMKGLKIAIARLANVYGCTQDHVDRVLPAFCRAAVEGKPLRIDGFKNTFDFTHISDTISGLILMIKQLEIGVNDLPPMHLLPGIPTTLKEAADITILAARSSSKIIEAPSRNYDVSRFYGTPYQAKKRLNWHAEVTPEQGIRMLVNDFTKQLEGTPV